VRKIVERGGVQRERWKRFETVTKKNSNLCRAEWKKVRRVGEKPETVERQGEGALGAYIDQWRESPPDGRKLGFV